jgi:hypothetical protein
MTVFLAWLFYHTAKVYLNIGFLRRLIGRIVRPYLHFEYDLLIEIVFEVDFAEDKFLWNDLNICNCAYLKHFVTALCSHYFVKFVIYRLDLLICQVEQLLTIRFIVLFSFLLSFDIPINLLLYESETYSGVLSS